MCEIFISADPQSYEGRTRSVRLHGVVTSIRLEHLFWDVLDEIAQRDSMSVVQLIEKLYDELVEARGEVGNFSSFLRVSALRYQALVAHGLIPSDTRVAIASLDAQAVLGAWAQLGAAVPAPSKLDRPAGVADSKLSH